MDKELSKNFAHGVLGYSVSVPTLGVIRRVEDVETFHLPRDCVIKAAHTAGNTIIRRGGEAVDRDEIRRWFSLNFYLAGRESVYRNLVPKVIVEPILFGGGEVDDYKIFCVDGKPKAILYVRDRNRNFGRGIFDPDWKYHEVGLEPRLGSDLPRRPEVLDEVLEITRKLAKHFGLVRIDWYINGDTYYLGEISHGHMRARERFSEPAGEALLSCLLFGWPQVRDAA